MQFARFNDVTLHYQVIKLPQSRPLLVFVNSLGTDFRIWRDVVVRLGGEFAVLLYDTRGHGLSETGRTPYSMAMLARDLAALLDHLGARQTFVCGVSVGGLIAQQLYARRPDLVRGLILCDTLGKIGDEAMWNARIAAIQEGGLDSVADSILTRWFTPEFRGGGPEYRAIGPCSPGNPSMATSRLASRSARRICGRWRAGSRRRRCASSATRTLRCRRGRSPISRTPFHARDSKSLRPAGICPRSSSPRR